MAVLLVPNPGCERAAGRTGGENIGDAECSLYVDAHSFADSPGLRAANRRQAPARYTAGMALKSTIYRVALSVADIDHGYYGDHALTIARHPSETDERMMVRLLAFALHADDALVFGRGLSAEDEPDLWRSDLTGLIEQWIEVGLPDEREVRKACGRAREVYILAYGGRAAELWWQGVREKLDRQERLAVSEVPQEASRTLAQMAGRSMELQVTIQEGHVLVTDGATSVSVELRVLKAMSATR